MRCESTSGTCNRTGQNKSLSEQSHNSGHADTALQKCELIKEWNFPTLCHMSLSAGQSRKDVVSLCAGGTRLSLLLRVCTRIGFARRGLTSNPKVRVRKGEDGREYIDKNA
eukprot:120155-Prorocentrum_minimum.AAC.2